MVGPDTEARTEERPLEFGTRVDLSEDSSFLLTLIDRPTAWRERLVEELSFEGAAHVSVASSYQINFPPAIVDGYVDVRRHRSANVLLPLTTREKRPLLKLAISGPSGAPAQLLSRASTAALEARYLSKLVGTSRADEVVLRAGLAEPLLEAICLFSPDFFNSILDDERDDLSRALARYLEIGLGSTIAVDPAMVVRWREMTAPAARVLRERARWMPDGLSSAEELLLTLPHLNPAPANSEEVEEIVVGFNAAVLALEAAGDRVLLNALAEYGRRYELIVEVEVPILEPFTMKISEDRVLGGPRNGWVAQTFRLGDARSAHLEARTVDPSVVIDDFRLSEVDGQAIASFGPIESVRHTDETLALYSSEPERPDFVTVGMRLRTRRHLRLISSTLATLNGLTIGTCLLMPHDDLLVERLALLTVPTTLAATVVLVREQTALATRLQASARARLGGSTVMLWLIVVAMLVTFHPKGRPQSGTTGGAIPRRGQDSAEARLVEGGKANGTQRTTRQRPHRRRERSQPDAQSPDGTVD